MKLIIEDDEGRKTVVPFVREEITIGRQEGNTIRLTERNVSRRHARLIRQNGHVLVEDLGSYNGIRLNGDKISGQTPIKDGDLVQIGDYDLAIQTEHVQPPPPPEEPTASAPTLDGEEATLTRPAGASEETPVPDLEPAREIPVLHPVAPPPAPAAAAAAAAEPTSDARRQQTSIIRVDQLEEARARREVAELDPEEAPRLFVLNTEFAGREFACIRTELRLGRTSDNDIALDHRSLSRSHAKLVREASGEWRVLDLESANGITVNGERYGQATLRSGDVIELGHVKLKFLLAGETFRVPGGGGSKRRWPLLLVALLALGAGGGAAWKLGYLHRFEVAQPELAPKDPEQPVAVTGPTPMPALKPPASEAPAVEVSDPAEKLRAAKQAIDDRDFEKAVDLLESLHGPDGARPAGADELLAQAQGEISARKAVAQARKEIAAGNFDAAAATLAPAQSSVAFAKDYHELKQKLDAAMPADAKHKPGAVAVKPAASPADEARRFLDEGTALFKRRQYREAKVFFTKCVELEPANARCHKMLGSTFASLRDLENGAKHYRLYVKYAPSNDPDVDKVKRLLEDYDRQNR